MQYIGMRKNNPVSVQATPLPTKMCSRGTMLYDEGSINEVSECIECTGWIALVDKRTGTEKQCF